MERYENIKKETQYSELFENKTLTARLDKLRDQLGTDLTIVIIGRKDLKSEDLVSASDPLRLKTKDASGTLARKRSSTKRPEEIKSSIVICYSKADKYDKSQTQEVIDTVKCFVSMQEKRDLDLVVPPLIVCHVKTESEKDDAEQFRTVTLSKIENKLGLKVNADDFIMGTVGSSLSDEISRRLENEIGDGILAFGDHLNTFSNTNKLSSMAKLEIGESDQLISTIQRFLKNGLAFVDMLEQQKDEPFIDIVLSNLARVIKCALLPPLAAKYSLLPDMCNIVAHEWKLEQNMIPSITKNTSYHLSKLQQPCEEMVEAAKSGDKLHLFPGEKFTFIAYPIRDDIKNTLCEFEKVIKGVQCSVAKLKKMMFEIRGCMKHTSSHLDGSRSTTEPNIPVNLRKAILGIDGVYGMGTVYDEIQIHVEMGKKETAQNEISDTMELLKFVQPYRVLSILQMPKLFCRCETGRCLHCQPEKIGTLGWFVRSDDNQLYALTSSHVVRGEDDNERDVFITSENQRPHLFAKSHPIMTVSEGDDGTSVDIAAVKVLNEYTDRCRLSLYDDERNEKRSELCTEAPHGLSGQYVYKYGAGSDFSKGIICSGDYTVCNARNEDFLILIESLPGLPGLSDKYADTGDSGAINCMIDINSTDRVKAVSMINKGAFKVEDNESELCLSFLLNVGIRKLSVRSGRGFNIP